MEKVISVREWATVKRIALSVNPMVQKKNAISRKMEELTQEVTLLDAQIEAFEHGIKALCCGLGTEDLVHREMTVTEGKFDKDGRPLKKVTYEPNPNVRFDRDKGVYVITVPDAGQQDVPVGTGLPDSDCGDVPVDKAVETTEDYSPLY